MISLVVAMSENRVIGIENRLPWNIPEDLKRFKKITSGHPIIMGRKTFESIGRPLPNRTNIVITRNKDYREEGIVACSSLEEAIEWAGRAPGSDEICIIGGGEIFRQALPIADRIYLTVVQWPFEGDAHFPEFDESKFKETAREPIADKPPTVLRVLDRKEPVLDWKK
jgi:dihydrofolate reductase